MTHHTMSERSYHEACLCWIMFFWQYFYKVLQKNPPKNTKQFYIWEEIGCDGALQSSHESLDLED